MGYEIIRDDFFESPNVVKQTRDDRKLTYNHYANCQPIDQDPTPFMSFSANEGTRSATLEQKLISGYDGFGGVHDNILWNVTAGFTYFTLNNKLIMENTKTRKQHVFHEP
jgi:hypothetical protein